MKNEHARPSTTSVHNRTHHHGHEEEGDAGARPGEWSTWMSAGVCSFPCSWTARMLSSAEEGLLKDMEDVQLMALFAKDLCMHHQH